MIATVGISFSQNSMDDKILKHRVNELRLFDVNGLMTFFEDGDDITTKRAAVQALHWKYSNLTNGTIEGFPKDSLLHFENDTTLQSSIFHLYYGDFLLASNVDESVAYTHHLKAKDIAVKIGDSLLICEALKRMIDHVNRREKNFPLLEVLIQEYSAAAFDHFEKDRAKIARIRARSLIDSKPYIEELFQGAELAKAHDNKITLAYYYKLIGVKYDVYAGHPDPDISKLRKSIDYYDRSLALYAQYEPAHWALKKKIGLLINKGIVYNFLGDHDASSFNLCYAKSFIRDTTGQNMVLFHQWTAAHLRSMNKPDSAYHHKVKEMKLRRRRYQNKIDLSVAEINTIYETEKREKENLKLKADIDREHRKQRNLLIVTVSVLVLGGSIAVLIQQNTIKKQKLAEQQKDIEEQKVMTLLKEQELANVDAMILGQEKERLRVANELHDDLGSLMATAKLHLNNIPTDKNDLAFKNTDKILDQVYEKIRTISHTKNVGVFSQEGLLPAVRKMAENISSSNGLMIEVNDHGMDNRIEGSLELTLFRITQELVTNIIKHSGADQASIQFTQHENTLNLIVEDNGRGFDTSTPYNTTDGMGLQNIQKRVRYLSGNLTVESIISKGTSIIINLPS